MSSTPDVAYKYESLQNMQSWRFLDAWSRGGEEELTRMSNEGWFGASQEPYRILASSPTATDDTLFTAQYPTWESPMPLGTLELRSGPHATYNWEALFHVPVFLAIRNKEAGEYESALYWLQMVFDPRHPMNEPERVWRFAPLREPDLGPVTDDGVLDEFSALLHSWRQDPYNPWNLARARPVALRRWIVSQYLECLVGWGDALFTQDTMESVNEAAALYLIAHRVVGTPSVGLGTLTNSTVAATPDLLLNGTLVIDAEDLVDHTRMVSVANTPDTARDWLASWSAGFCVPENPQADAWRKTIQDRLFKIRNSLDIRGVKRQLPFFAPPIDPALLVRARAEGLSIQQVLHGSSNPAGYRGQTLLSLALEFTQDVRGFGSAILSALEKRDSEALGLLRQNQEHVILSASRVQRDRAIEEARVQRAVLDDRLQSAQARVAHFEKLLSPGSGLGGNQHPAGVSQAEARERQWTEEAVEDEGKAGRLADAAAASALIPTVTTTFTSGIPFKFETAISIGLGSQLITQSFQFASQLYQRKAAQHRASAANAGTDARNERRNQEWRHALDQAKREARIAEREVLSADLRMASMEFEAAQLERQIEHNEEVDRYLRSKFTNADLYDWMVSRLTQLHDTALTMAVAMARRAVDAIQRELWPDDSTEVLTISHQRERRGLLAGDALLQDLRKVQEYRILRAPPSEVESTARFSLREWSPALLLALRHRTSGSITFEVPRQVYDAHYPLHRKRRIRSVALTIPAVVASAAGVRATLRLTQSLIEDSASALAAGPMPSRNEMVTSTGVEDIGFADEPSQAERYRPFELAGAVSKWTLEVGQAENRLDRRSIEDVILQVRHVARVGPASDAYKLWRTGEVPETEPEEGGPESSGGDEDVTFPSHPIHLVDVISQYPDQWHAWVANGGTLALPMRQDQLEHMRAGETVEIKSLQVLIDGFSPLTEEVEASGPWDTDGTVSTAPVTEVPADTLLEDWSAHYTPQTSPAADGNLDVVFGSGISDVEDRKKITSLYLLLGYVAVLPSP